MKIRAWRISSSRWTASAFTGEGARLTGGRWNSKGTPIVYLASSLALAALELLVHIDHERALADHLAIPVEFDESAVEALVPEDVPSEFPAPHTVAHTRLIGDSWVRSGTKPLLRVPSAVIRQEYNFLLNPGHERFSEVTIGEPQRFTFDRRLLERKS